MSPFYVRSSAKALVQTIATIRLHQFTARNRAFHFISNLPRRSHLLSLPRVRFQLFAHIDEANGKQRAERDVELLRIHRMNGSALCVRKVLAFVARRSENGERRGRGLHLPMKSRFGCVIFDARELHAGHTIGSTGSLSLTRSGEGNESTKERKKKQTIKNHFGQLIYLPFYLFTLSSRSDSN